MKKFRNFIKKAEEDNKGATLVELITSVAIFGIIVAAAMSLLIFVTNINRGELERTSENNRIISAERLLKNMAFSSEFLEIESVNAGTEERLVSITFSNGDENSRKLVFDSETGTLSYLDTMLMTGVRSVLVNEKENADGGKWASIELTSELNKKYEIFLSCKNG